MCSWKANSDVISWSSLPYSSFTIAFHIHFTKLSAQGCTFCFLDFTIGSRWFQIWTSVLDGAEGITVPRAHYVGTRLEATNVPVLVQLCVEVRKLNHHLHLSLLLRLPKLELLRNLKSSPGVHAEMVISSCTWSIHIFLAFALLQGCLNACHLFLSLLPSFYNSHPLLFSCLPSPPTHAPYRTPSLLVFPIFPCASVLKSMHILFQESDELLFYSDKYLSVFI